MKAENEFQKTILFQLADSRAYEFLSLSRIVGQIDKISVSQSQILELERLLRAVGIKFSQIKEAVLPPKLATIASGQRLAYDGFYYSEEIYNSIETMSNEVNADRSSPIRSRIWQYGSTDKGLPMYAIRVGLKANDESTVPIVLGDAGIHGNEWIGPLSGHKIIENMLFNSTGLTILQKVDVIFTACVNRDGYDGSLGRSFSLMYGRKNQMKSEKHECVIEKSEGTNINRNFDFHWDSEDSRDDPCNFNYRGDYPHSAPETAALVDLMKIPNVVFYYTIHSFGNLLLYPYGHSDEKVGNLDQMRAVALEGQRVLQEQFGQKYVVGSTYQVLYITSGASKDYAYGVAKIPISLIHEIGGEPMDFQPRLENIPVYTDMAWCSFEAMTLKVIEVLHL